MVRVLGDRCCYREDVGEVVIASALAGGQDPREGTSEEECARPTSQEGYSQKSEQHQQREKGIYLPAMGTVRLEEQTEMGGQTAACEVPGMPCPKPTSSRAEGEE